MLMAEMKSVLRYTPLHRAICSAEYKLRKQIIKLLLEHGADTSAVNNEGRTPLMVFSDCYYKFGNLGFHRGVLGILKFIKGQKHQTTRLLGWFPTSIY